MLSMAVQSSTRANRAPARRGLSVILHAALLDVLRGVAGAAVSGVAKVSLPPEEAVGGVGVGHACEGEGGEGAEDDRCGDELHCC